MYLGECLWLVQIIIDLHNEHVNRLPINVSLISVALKKAVLVAFVFYLEVEYLVTALVPSLTACLASSPGRINLTEVWTSLDEIVDFLLWTESLEASPAILSKASLTKEFIMFIAFPEIPIFGWTCLRTL